MQKTMAHAGLWLVLVIVLRLPRCPPLQATHTDTHTHIACHPAINSDRGHEGALRCSALVAEGFCRREPLGRSSWAWFLRRGRPANLNIRIVSTSTPLQPVLVHNYCNLVWSKKRKLANHYDLYEKASSEPEKLQNQSVFQLKSVNPHISPNPGFTIFVVRERSRRVEFRKNDSDLYEKCSATLILRHTRRKPCYL